MQLQAIMQQMYATTGNNTTDLFNNRRLCNRFMQQQSVNRQLCHRFMQQETYATDLCNSRLRQQQTQARQAQPSARRPPDGLAEPVPRPAGPLGWSASDSVRAGASARRTAATLRACLWVKIPWLGPWRLSPDAACWIRHWEGIMRAPWLGSPGILGFAI